MHRSSRLLGVALLASAVLAIPATASAQTVAVYAGGPTTWSSTLQHKYGAGINNFLINKVVINAGDTVQWNGASLAAGFHTVDIPSLSQHSDLPFLTPTGKTVSGATDAAGNPFWFDNGYFASLSFNPLLFAASGGTKYDGSARLDSGLPAGKPHNFSVTFTKPGTYKFFCDIHPGMFGEVVVKKAGAAVPSAAQNASALAREEKGYVKESARVLKEKVAAGTVSLGKSGPGGVEIFAMFPSTLSVKAGTTVSFQMSKDSREVHTASFGPAAYLTGLSKSFQSPAPSPLALYPSDPPGTITLGPTTHGNGFASTGALDQDPATATIPALGAIKFTTPGTYTYQCLIHPFMRGKIVVTS